MTSPTDAAISAPLFGPEMLADPYPVYRRLRETDPVHWHEPFGAWVLTRYHDVVAALNDPRFSAERTGAMQALTGRPELKPFFDFLAVRMLFTDPPRHTRLRGLVSKAFTPHAVEAMRSHIQTLVDQFLDRVRPQGQMDVIADLAYPLPVTVIIEMLGVPTRDRERLKRWSDEFVVYFSKAPNEVTPEEYATAARAVAAEEDYFRAAVAHLRTAAEPGLLGGMARAEEAGDRLTEQELYANANLLLTAGHETTTNLIGNGTLAMLRHPDQLEKLRADPSLLPAAIEEFLRFDAPVQFTHRVAKENVTIGDKLIRRGQFVYLILAAANRDPDRFADPDRLDITRKDNHHVAFGQGPHFCLGAPLARLEAQIAFAALLRQFPAFRLAADRVAYRPTFNLRGLQSLPVAFERTSGPGAGRNE
jgi:cytochrome P450